MVISMKLKKILLTVLFFVAFAVMIISFVKIVFWGIDNYKTNAEIKKIQEIVEIDEVESDNKEEDETIVSSKFINVDFTELKKTNNDVVGWIRVNGTSIDYPFVQYTDNSYYLNHSFDKSVNDAGWVFLDYQNKVDMSDTNTIIYAHGRVDGTMFGSLKNALNKNYLNIEEKFIKISTLTDNYIFEVFSVYHIPTTDDYLRKNFNSSEDYASFINMIKQRSVHNFSVDVLNDDKIITLSTCYNNREKVVMHGKLVDSVKKD